MPLLIATRLSAFLIFRRSAQAVWVQGKNSTID